MSGLVRKSLLAVAIVLVGALDLGESAHALSRPLATPQHTLFYDTGFDISRNGFRFANWSGLTNGDALTFANLQRLINGDGTCDVDNLGPHCHLRNAYRLDLSHVNSHLAAGRCEGMVVLAARLFMRPREIRVINSRKKKLTASSLTRAETADEIAYWWASQLSPTIFAETVATRSLEPHEFSHAIYRQMKRQGMVSLGLYGDDGTAHSVLPISMSMNNVRSVIRTYDPNFPGETLTLIIFHKTDSWFYTKAVRADGKVAPLTGTGPGNLDFVPINARDHLGWWSQLADF